MVAPDTPQRRSVRSLIPLLTWLPGYGRGRAAQLVAAITLVAGVLFLPVAILRMGWIARFLSRPVITGFLAGAAVDVVIGDLPKLTGTSADGANAWRELGSWARTLDDLHWTTVAVGVVGLCDLLPRSGDG